MNGSFLFILNGKSKLKQSPVRLHEESFVSDSDRFGLRGQTGSFSTFRHYRRHLLSFGAMALMFYAQWTIFRGNNPANFLLMVMGALILLAVNRSLLVGKLTDPAPETSHRSVIPRVRIFWLIPVFVCLVVM